MGAFIDLTGMRFDRLTVIERDMSKTGRRVYWICLCDCGNTKSVSGACLKAGRVRSCGCLHRDVLRSREYPHDAIHKENKRLYNIWRGIFQRCYNANYSQYKNYGGRGIEVCQEWKGESGFKRFVCWAKSNGYRDDLTIDRIDVNGNYVPQNCRWITHKGQQNNRTNNRYITYNGETKTLMEWSELYGIRFATLKHRLDTLSLPFDVAIKVGGLEKVICCGREISIRRLAQMKHIDYKTLLHLILVDNMTADDAIKRMIDNMG